MTLNNELAEQLRTTYLQANPGLDRAALVESVLRVLYDETKFGNATPIDQTALSTVLDAAAEARTHMLNNPETATVKVREYPDYRTIGPELSLPYGNGPTGGFERESDWYYNATGHSVAPGGRWLVTFAWPNRMREPSLGFPKPEEDSKQDPAGWLIAYEIDAANSKTNRVIILAGPWNHHTDTELHTRRPGPDPDLDDLILWLTTTAP